MKDLRDLKDLTIPCFRCKWLIDSLKRYMIAQHGQALPPFLPPLLFFFFIALELGIE
jgi:hypothetical protein